MTSQVIDLAFLSANQGFAILGQGAGFGRSVAGAGDINDDGIPDQIIGAPGGTGAAFIVYGTANPGQGPVDLDTFPVSRGFVISGDSDNDSFGTSLSFAGDVNNDGIDDLIIGAPFNDDGDNTAGAAYLIFGKPGTARTAFDVTTLLASDGFSLVGALLDERAARAVSGAGDVNGDGIDDFLVGAPYSDDGGNIRGKTYVVFGKEGATRPNIDFAALSPSDGFAIRGAQSPDVAGNSVAAAGDVNGDGIDDLVFGAYRQGTTTGAAYVIFGKTGATRGNLELNALDPADGFLITGDAVGDAFGFSVSGVGDINGDGIDDIVVGAHRGDDVGTDSGEAYVIYGKNGPTRAGIDVTTLDVADGFVIRGSAAGNQLGRAVSAAGDVNNDGINDLLVGAHFNADNGTRAGAAYVVYGQSGTRGPVLLSALDAGDGFIVRGARAYDNAAISLSAAGDVNGDGFADILIGAPYNDDGGTNAGAAYVIYGFATNAAPLAADDSFSLDEDGSAVFAPLANDSDADSDPLTLAIVTGTANGTITRNSDNTVTYEPNDNFSGTDSFTYTVSDGSLTSNIATVTITINPVNDAPVAVADAAVTDEDDSVTIAVLANDSDIDSSLLSVASVTQGINGSVAVNPDGTVTYTPNADFFGTDSFTYTVSDGSLTGNTATVTVTVNPVNDAPVITGNGGGDTAAINYVENLPGVVSIVSATDIDSPTLTYSISGADAALFGVDPTSGGLFFLAPPDFETPLDADSNGVYEVTVTASDGDLADSQALSITVTDVIENTVPMAADDSFALDEDGSADFAPLANDSDGEDDPLTLTIVTGTANGTIARNFDNTVTYTPNADFVGTDSFTYTISDGSLISNTATATITINPVNDAPVAVADAAVTDEDDSVTIAVLANDSDIDSSLLSVASVTQGINGSVAINPDGTVTYTPNADFAGTDSFTYTISDGSLAGNTATATITINPVNDAPVAVADAAVTDEDNAVTIAVLANDSDIDSSLLSVASVTQGINGSVAVNPDGTVTYTPNADFFGTDSFTYTVSDGSLAGNTATATITINPVNDAPRDLAVVGGIAENSGAGAPAGVVLVTDPDAGDSFTFALVDDGGRFAIDSATGALSALAGASFDFETAQSHAIEVEVTDAAGASFRKRLDVAVTNVVEDQRFIGTPGQDVFVAVSDDNWFVDGRQSRDTITTLGGNDTIVLDFSGNDTVSTGGGDDVFRVGARNGSFNAIDGGDGFDTIIATRVFISIGLVSLADVELISAGGFRGVKVTGTQEDDVLSFAGVTMDGINAIELRNGDDDVTGSGGDDRILGGNGADTLAGGGGNDVFAYAKRTESGTGAKADTILDLGDGDRIDLSAIDADQRTAGNQAFVFIGDADFTGLGQLRAFTENGVTIIQANTTSSLAADMEIVLANGFAVDAGDFLL